MRASRRVVRAAQAVAAGLVGLVLSQGVMNKGVWANPTECSAAEQKEIEFADSTTQVQFKCSGAFTELVPQNLTKVYPAEAEHESSGVEPVFLESLVHKAVLKSDGSGTPTYTLAVAPSTVIENDTVLYYFCKQPQSVNYCRLRITMKKRAAKPAETCDSGTLKKITMDKTDTLIKFACHNSFQTLLPAKPNHAYTARGKKEVPLDTLYPGAELQKGQEYEHTLIINQRRSSKILYFRCQKSTDGNCDFQVTVEKNLEGDVPGAVPESATCHAGTTEVPLTLSSQHPGVAFACGVDVPELGPEKLTEVYDKDHGRSPIALTQLFKKASLYTDSSVAAYSYYLHIPYRDEPRTLYYTCKKDDQTCRVKITVEPNNNVIPVCQNAQTGAYLSYEDFSENVKFKCDAQYPGILPKDLATVYDVDPTVDKSAQPVKLTSVYSGAKLVSDGNKQSPTFTLTIPQHLPRETKKIYYQCKRADNDYCTVHIRVAQKNPDVVTCADSANKEVTITGAGEIVRFKCGLSMTLHPGNDLQVYNNEDGECAVVADLATLVPNASLKTDEKDTDAKKITFSELPSTDKALCYSCSNAGASEQATAIFRAPQVTKQCKILINVRSAAIGLNGQAVAGHALLLVSLAGALISSM